MARLRAVLGTYVERGEVPGLVAAVVRHGMVHFETLGTLGVDDRRPIQRDSIFRISSLTKPITAVATMLLVEECALRLDDPIDPWLPELADRPVMKDRLGPLTDTVPAARAVTVRDLLTMRDGFGQFLADPEQTPILKALLELNGYGPPQPQATPSADELLRRLGALPRMHQPGELWLYNTPYDLLGVLIARVSGAPFEQFLRERIFAPLGMKDTGFSVDEDQRRRLVTSYQPGPRGLSIFDAPDGQWSRPPAFCSGAGGLVSTAMDYLAFARMLLSGGKIGRERFLSRPSIELMLSNQLSSEERARSGLMPGDFANRGYGFGVSMVLQRDSLASLGQYGWDGGMGQTWRNDPARDLTGLLLTQVNWSAPRPPPVCQDFWTLTYAALDD